MCYLPFLLVSYFIFILKYICILIENQNLARPFKVANKSLFIYLSKKQSRLFTYLMNTIYQPFQEPPKISMPGNGNADMDQSIQVTTTLGSSTIAPLHDQLRPGLMDATVGLLPGIRTAAMDKFGTVRCLPFSSGSSCASIK